jgi:membrane protein YdbS with pleckstrin-like domain
MDARPSYGAREPHPQETGHRAFLLGGEGSMWEAFPMAFSEKLLGQGEHVVLHLRTHWKALIGSVLVFLVMCLAVGAGVGVLVPMVAEGSRQILTWVIVGLAVVLFVALSLLPFMRWWTTTFTITNRRLITRRGILNKSGHDLPLIRINNVEYQRSLLDRMLGCGTLTLTTAAEDPLTLRDIPGIEHVHLQLGELMTAADSPSGREDA